MSLLAGILKRTGRSEPQVTPAATPKDDAEALFRTLLGSDRLRSVKLEQLFPGISRVPVEIGAIDPDTGHPNHVDMPYVVAIARFRQSRAIFEFGTYLGRTTYHLALGNPDAVVHTLDLKPQLVTSDQKIGGAIRNVMERDLQGVFFRNTECAERIRQLHGDSRYFDYSPFRQAMDFIFIDASHLYEFVKNDTFRAMEMLAPGGIMIWHDFAAKSPGLVRFIAEHLCEQPLFHIEKTSLLVHMEGVDPLSAELPPLPYEKHTLKL